MKEQVDRADATLEHRQLCQNKLNVLLEQKKDLSTAIDQLIADIEAGRKYMKVYKQMKMYNDPSTNPVLYGKKWPVPFFHTGHTPLPTLPLTHTPASARSDQTHTK